MMATRVYMDARYAIIKWNRTKERFICSLFQFLLGCDSYQELYLVLLQGCANGK